MGCKNLLAMIEIKNISFGYSKRRPAIFRNLSLSIDHGGIYGLLGGNGSGKSTLIYLICGLLPTDEGSILIDGQRVDRRIPQLLREMYLVPEKMDLPDVSFKQLLALHHDYYPLFSDDDLKDCLQRFNVSPANTFTGLSMGERKKLLLSFALAANTRYIFMDEPVNGLDLLSKEVFRQAVADHVRGERVALIATHQIHDVEQMLTNVLLLSNRQVVVNTTTADILSQYSFTVRSEAHDADVVYAQPAPDGYFVMTRRKEGSTSSSVNLELYFNALTQQHKQP